MRSECAYHAQTFRSPAQVINPSLTSLYVLGFWHLANSLHLCRSTLLIRVGPAPPHICSSFPTSHPTSQSFRTTGESRWKVLFSNHSLPGKPREGSQESLVWPPATHCLPHPSAWLSPLQSGGFLSGPRCPVLSHLATSLSSLSSSPSPHVMGCSTSLECDRTVGASLGADGLAPMALCFLTLGALASVQDSTLGFVVIICLVFERGGWPKIEKQRMTLNS